MDSQTFQGRLADLSIRLYFDAGLDSFQGTLRTLSENRDEAMAFWAEMLTQYQQAVAAIFEEGARTGEFRSVNASALTWMIMAAYDGLAAYDMMMPDLDMDRISETFVETLLKGLEADGEPE